jgi:enoyl-[acyl-carrier protein] reductase I
MRGGGIWAVACGSARFTGDGAGGGTRPSGGATASGHHGHEGAGTLAGLLSGKRALIQGVLNRHSICWGIAESMAREGAELCLTYQNERLREGVQECAATLPSAFTLPLDLQRDDEIEAVAAARKERWGALDALVVGAAFARREELDGEFIQVSRDGFHLALDVSVYGFVALTRACRPLLKASGAGAVLTLTYIGSERVIPNYNVMGVAKAALEAAVRYLAADLGPENIRVNAISAGPVRTVAASGVRGVGGMIGEVAERSPLRRKTDRGQIGDTAAFLASDLARGLTGDIVYVDNGFHVLGLAEGSRT